MITSRRWPRVIVFAYRKLKYLFFLEKGDVDWMCVSYCDYHCHSVGCRIRIKNLISIKTFPSHKCSVGLDKKVFIGEEMQTRFFGLVWLKETNSWLGIISTYVPHLYL